MNKKIENIKNLSVTAFYIVLIVCIIVFTINYAFVDWEEVMEDFDEGMEDLMKGIYCEIDYKDFHFKGMCVDKEEIFNFLINQSNVNG